MIDNNSAVVVDTETGLAEDKKDERSRLTATVREIERFLSDGLVKVYIRNMSRTESDINMYFRRGWKLILLENVEFWNTLKSSLQQ